MRKLLLIGLSSWLVLGGCDDAPKPGATTAGGTQASASAPKKKAPPKKAMAAPEPLDVAALIKALKCRPKAPGPCAVLRAFQQCIAFNPVTASGDGRWLGRSFITKDGSFVDEFGVLRSRRVGTSEVAPGQLPAKIAFDRIPDDRGAERRHAVKALRAFNRGDIPTRTNQAVRYLKARNDWSEHYAMQAGKNQVYVQTDNGTYLCARNDQRLLVVQRRGAAATSTDGTYATLWPVSW